MKFIKYNTRSKRPADDWAWASSEQREARGEQWADAQTEAGGGPEAEAEAEVEPKAEAEAKWRGPESGVSAIGALWWPIRNG